MGIKCGRGSIWLRKGCCVGFVRDNIVKSAKSESLTTTVLGGRWFQTEFGGGWDGEVALGSGYKSIGSFLVVALDVVEIRIWRGLSVFKVEGCVARVRKRIGGWDWFCNFV